MKSIENKTVCIKGTYMNYAGIIGQCLNPPQGGYDLNTMAAHLKIKGVIEAADNDNAEKLVFEDADVPHLKAAVNSNRWTIADQAIVDFIKDINNIC